MRWTGWHIFLLVLELSVFIILHRLHCLLEVILKLLLLVHTHILDLPLPLIILIHSSYVLLMAAYTPPATDGSIVLWVEVVVCIIIY